MSDIDFIVAAELKAFLVNGLPWSVTYPLGFNAHACVRACLPSNRRRSPAATAVVLCRPRPQPLESRSIDVDGRSIGRPSVDRRSETVRPRFLGTKKTTRREEEIQRRTTEEEEEEVEGEEEGEGMRRRGGGQIVRRRQLRMTLIGKQRMTTHEHVNGQSNVLRIEE